MGERSQTQKKKKTVKNEKTYGGVISYSEGRKKHVHFYFLYIYRNFKEKHYLLHAF